MIHSKWSAQAHKAGEDRAIRLYLDLWLYAIYAEGRPIVELLARWHLLRHKNNTIWLGFLAIELMYWARGTWQLGNRQMPSASACHFFVGIFFYVFRTLSTRWHIFGNVKTSWNCLITFYIHTFGNGPAENRSISRQVGDSGKQFWSLLMGLGRKIHWPIIEDRFHHGWNQLKSGRFRWVCVMSKNGGGDLKKGGKATSNAFDISFFRSFMF